MLAFFLSFELAIPSLWGKKSLLLLLLLILSFRHVWKVENKFSLQTQDVWTCVSFHRYCENMRNFSQIYVYSNHLCMCIVSVREKPVPTNSILNDTDYMDV